MAFKYGRSPRTQSMNVVESMSVNPRARRIVETAVELAEQGGFEAVRLREVAARAEVALGTLYRHFASKEDLLVAALESEIEELVEQMKASPIVGDSAHQRVVTYFRTATTTLCRRPKLARAVLRSAASGEPAPTEKLMGFHDLSTRMALAAIRGRTLAGDIEAEEAADLDPALVLQQVWFSSLVGWMGGLFNESEVVAEVERAASLFLTPGQG